MFTLQQVGAAAKRFGSDMSGTMRDTLSCATGTVTKAVLIFHKTEPKQTDKMQYGTSDGQKGLCSNVAEKLSSALSQEGSGSLNMTGQPYGQCVTLQFNPSSIQINAVGGGRYPVTNYGTGEGESTICFTDMDPSVQISFKVIFDRTHNADAFMADKFVLNYEQVTQNVVTLALGEEYSVRPQMEGFLGAIRNQYHRLVTFQWGSMRYSGTINQIRGKYTMFNVSGNPIRAEIGFNIMVQHTGEEDNLEYWRQRYADILRAQRSETKGLSGVNTGHVRDQLRNLIQL